MTWSVTAERRKILDREIGGFRREAGEKILVALIWPGTYRAGMSALGYLSIYGLLNRRPEVQAERFFLPEGRLAREYERTGTPLVSLENGRSLRDFDLVAASLSLENDYWLLPELLMRGGLAGRREERTPDDPPVLAGGVAVWANPEPLRSFADLILTGEAEAQWPQLISAWEEIRFSSLPKPDRVRHLGRNTPGALIAAPDGQRGEPLKPHTEGLPHRIPVQPAALQWPPPNTLLPPVSPLLSPDTEFAHVKLVEISRGCPYGCRFCLAGFLFRPHRPWPLTHILEALGPPVTGERVGLISPAAADHPELAELLKILMEQGRQVTLSSLRLTALTPELARHLAEGRLKGLAVAPEGGGEKIRRVINKNLTEFQILAGCRLLAESGLKKLKLYFMVGLPGETDQDIKDLTELVTKIRRETQLKSGAPELTVSLANFTPKAQTPFEEVPMLPEMELRRRARLVVDGLKGLPRLSVNLDPPKWSLVQGLLARAEAGEGSRLVEALRRNQGRCGPALKEIGYTSAQEALHRPWPAGRPKPWRSVEPSVGWEILARESEAAGIGQLTPPCPPQGLCGRCQACRDGENQGGESTFPPYRHGERSTGNQP